MDEASPHLHLDYVPVAHGYSRGLDTRNSLDKALKEQGIEVASDRKKTVKDKETGEVKSTFQGFFHSGGKSYYSGSTGEFKITFPSAADAARTTARRAAKATTFARHLNGYAQFDKNAKKANKIIKGIALKKDVILK
jgi:hypothetical protein